MTQKELLALLASVSEAREELIVHRSDPKDSDEWRSADKAKYEAVLAAERTLRDKSAAAEEEPEDARLGEVQERIECRNYVGAALRDAKLTGAEAEFNAERGLPDANVMPWAALAPREPIEARDDDATTIEDVVAGQPQMEVLRRVFEQGNVSFLGIRTPSVPFGSPNFPVMGDGTVPYGGEALEPGAEIEADAITFTQKVIDPTRLTARYKLRVEDSARFPALEDILRSDLRMVMTQLRDYQVLAGDGSTAGTTQNLTGVLKTLNGLIAEDFTAAIKKTDETVAAVPDWQKLEKLLYEPVDGRYASMASGVRWLFGVDTYKFLARIRLGTPENPLTFLEWMSRMGIMFSTSAFIPAAGNLAANAQDAAPVSNVQVCVRTVRGTDAVAPVWEGIQLVRDPYTGAAKGEVAITAFALHGFGMLRDATWGVEGVKVA